MVCKLLYYMTASAFLVETWGGGGQMPHQQVFWVGVAVKQADLVLNAEKDTSM